MRDLACALYKRGPKTALSEHEESQLRSLGADNEYIEQKRAAMLEDAANLPDIEITIWPDMESAIRIFQFCHWELVAGMGGAHWTGIPATETQAVAAMLGIATDDELLADLRAMQDAASAILNAKN